MSGKTTLILGGAIALGLWYIFSPSGGSSPGGNPWIPPAIIPVPTPTITPGVTQPGGYGDITRTVSGRKTFKVKGGV